MTAVWIAIAAVAFAAAVLLLAENVRRRRRERAKGRIESLPVESVPLHDAPRAWKCARLVVSRGDDALHLAGIVVDAPYGAEETAICRGNDDHVPPVVGCRCGFYAFADREEALQLLLEPMHSDPSEIVSVLCEVDLQGTVIAYERGYRAARQRVLSVGLVPFCTACASQGRVTRADVVGVAPRHRTAGTSLDLMLQGPKDPFAPFDRPDRGWESVSPLCRTCARTTGTVVWHVSEVAANLATEVTWLPEATVNPSRVLVRHQAAVAHG